MDQQLLAEVKDWVGFRRIPEVIMHKRTPDRVMKLLHIANDPQEILKLIPYVHHRNKRIIEKCQKYLKIFAVGLTYAHYSTEGFSAVIDFPSMINLNGAWIKQVAFYDHEFNKIIVTPGFMLILTRILILPVAILAPMRTS